MFPLALKFVEKKEDKMTRFHPTWTKCEQCDKYVGIGRDDICDKKKRKKKQEKATGKQQG